MVPDIDTCRKLVSGGDTQSIIQLIVGNVNQRCYSADFYECVVLLSANCCKEEALLCGLLLSVVAVFRSRLLCEGVVV